MPLSALKRLISCETLGLLDSDILSEKPSRPFTPPERFQPTRHREPRRYVLSAPSTPPVAGTHPSFGSISSRMRRRTIAAANTAQPELSTIISEPAGPLVTRSGGPAPAPRRVHHARGHLWQSLQTRLVLQRLTRRYPFLSNATDPRASGSYWLLCFRDSRPLPGTPSRKG